METKSRLSLYRDELKGLAVLWIVCSHMRLPVQSPVLSQLLRCGYGGVDVLMLLSGYGLYRSLERSDDLKGYLRRRAARLLPAYLPFCLLWLCVMTPLYRPSPVAALRTALGNLLMIGFTSGAPYTISWYMDALLFTILLAPAFYACLGGGRSPWRSLALLLALSFALGPCFIADERLIVFSRFPVFVLGMGATMQERFPLPRPLSQRGKTLLLWGAFLLGGALLCLCEIKYDALLLDYGMYWYPFFLMAPPLCAGACRLFRLAGEKAKALTPLRAVGRASFEVFLFNVWFETLAKKIWRWEASSRYLWLGLASVAAGLAYHWLVAFLLRKRKPAA